MKTISKILIWTVSLLAVPLFVLGAPTSVDRLVNHIEPLIKSDFIKAQYYVATSTTATSTFVGNMWLKSNTSVTDPIEVFRFGQDTNFDVYGQPYSLKWDGTNYMSFANNGGGTLGIYSSCFYNGSVCLATSPWLYISTGIGYNGDAAFLYDGYLGTPPSPSTGITKTFGSQTGTFAATSKGNNLVIKAGEGYGFLTQTGAGGDLIMMSGKAVTNTTIPGGGAVGGSVTIIASSSLSISNARFDGSSINITGGAGAGANNIGGHIILNGGSGTTTGNIGVATSSPFKTLSVTGEIYSTATSTASCFTTNGTTCITGGAGVTGGTAGMLTSWVNSTTLTATGTPSAAAFYATSTTGTATTSLVDTIIRGRTASDKAEIFVAADQLNGSVDALYIVPPISNGRIFFGRSGKVAYSLNMSNVTNVESVPNLQLNSKYISFDSGSYQQITGASSGTGTFHFGYWGLEFRGNEQGAWTGTKTHYESASAASAMFVAGAANRVNVALYGRASQTADLLQFKNSSFSVLSTFDALGRLGIGTTTSLTSSLTVATSTANATSTVTVGKPGQNKGSCLELYRSDGSVIYAYVAAGATTFTLSTTSCK